MVKRERRVEGQRIVALATWVTFKADNETCTVQGRIGTRVCGD